MFGLVNVKSEQQIKTEEKWLSLPEFRDTPRPPEDGITRHSRTQKITSRGDLYTGEWNKFDEIHGFGHCLYYDGSFYEGFWDHNIPHGRGRLIDVDQ